MSARFFVTVISWQTSDMTYRARPVLIAAAVLFALPLAAAPARQTMIMTKVGKTNVQVQVILHPQVDGCAPALFKEVKREAVELGQAHIRDNLAKLKKKAGTDASGPKEFFGVNYLAGCPKDGTAWLAFPAEGKDKQVTRYAPGLGWSAMMKL